MCLECLDSNVKNGNLAVTIIKFLDGIFGNVHRIKKEIYKKR